MGTHVAVGKNVEEGADLVMDVVVGVKVTASVFALVGIYVGARADGRHPPLIIERITTNKGLNNLVSLIPQHVDIFHPNRSPGSITKLILRHFHLSTSHAAGVGYLTVPSLGPLGVAGS